MPPPYSLSGIRKGKVFARLNQWAEADGRGIAGARRAPDAAWMLKSRVRALDPEMIDRYWRLCPDFVIELHSQTDRPRVLHEKMRELLANGAQLAWLIDPETRTVEICRPNREPRSWLTRNRCR
jgi:Uma2 family endonuclease